jgi:NMD protein affecting ribosome stability and mRNA decay|uniref:ATPase n=1 Tax=Desulfobacca acetoxidans TaxID=60893 RepID=A0A7V6A567_9BACT
MGRFPKEHKYTAGKGKKFGHVGRTEDPYQPEEGQEASLCTTCRAIYQNKRWFFDEKLADRLAGTSKVKEVTCPTCRKIRDHYPEGILTLTGEFLQDHQEEITTLLSKEAERVGRRSVADRIMTMTEQGKNQLVVETTTEKLAQHLGRALYKAYKGDLNFKWGEMDKLVRVYWSR